MANNEVTLRIGADASKLNTGLNRAKASVKSFAGAAKASISAVGKSIGNMNISPILGPLLIGGGIHYTVNAVGDLSRELLYYGMAAKKSDADTQVFRESLHNMAIQTGVDSRTILNSIAKIGEITGDFKFSEDMGLLLAKTSLAANTSMEDLALLSSAINSNLGWGEEKIAKYFNSLIIQGDQGSFTLQKFAQEGKALFSSAAAFGLKSEDQFAYFGAMLQTIAPAIKSDAEITTSVGALFRDLKDKQKELGKKGIKIFDKVDGKNQVRDFKSIIDDIMKYVDGDAKKLAQIGLTSESMKVLNPLMADYQKKWEKMSAITQSGLDGMSNTTVLDDRYNKATRTFDKSMEKMKASALKFVDLNLAGPVETLSNAINALSEHQTLLQLLFGGATLSFFGVKGYKTGKGIFNFFKELSSKKSSEYPSNVIPFSPNDVQKVFVTNMGGGFGGSNYYMDDDGVFPNVKKAANNTAETFNQTTKEVGKFKYFASQRKWLDSILSTKAGMFALGSASILAAQQIAKFFVTLHEWRNVVADAEANSAAAVSTNDKNFREKYGSSAAHWSEKASAALLEAQKEGNSLFGSQKRIDKLMADFQRYSKLASEEVKKTSAEEYMKNMTVAPNIVINMDPWNNRYTAQSDGGKPAKVKLKNTPNLGK